MNVLNLFAGMEVGRLACERAGVPIDKYYSSEIDKYAIQVSKANWPDIIHLGDVTKVYGCTLPDIHLLLGGSPCQGFSFAGKQLNFNDPRSALLFEYVRILKELRVYNPNVYFLLENVMMKKEYQDVISELLGAQPIMINSALVSAQNRKRLYWTNIPFLGQPADKGIVLKDILETNKHNFLSETETAYMDRVSSKGRNRWDFGLHSDSGRLKSATITANQGVPTKALVDRTIKLGNVQPAGRGMNGEVYSIEGKSPTLTTNNEQRTTNKGEGSKIGCYQVGLADDIKGFDANRRIYSQDGKAPTLISSTGGHKAPKVEIPQDVYLSEEEVQRGIYQAQGKVWKSGNKMGKMGNMDFPNNPDKKAKTLCTVNTKGGRETNHVLENGLENVLENGLENGFTYRKLTVTECERLQTVPDGYTQRLSATAKQISNTQAYKMLGNGWTTDVIAHLLLPLGDYSCLF
jgi:DNA (cytosine-5)-methyltransferase 3A